MSGSHEAVELRDDDKEVYMGKGVLKAVANVNDKIAPAIMGMDPTQQAKIDKTMMEVDKTENKVCIKNILNCQMSLVHWKDCNFTI